jgi:anti-sigma factor RsiW
MNCNEAQSLLAAYHFGDLEPGKRADLEAHLPSCPRCVEAFVATKREIEVGPAPVQASPAARRRLREAVSAELFRRTAPRWIWWDRPLAFAVATAALILAVVGVHQVMHIPGAAPVGYVARHTGQ